MSETSANSNTDSTIPLVVDGCYVDLNVEEYVTAFLHLKNVTNPYFIEKVLSKEYLAALPRDLVKLYSTLECDLDSLLDAISDEETSEEEDNDDKE